MKFLYAKILLLLLPFAAFAQHKSEAEKIKSLIEYNGEWTPEERKSNGAKALSLVDKYYPDGDKEYSPEIYLLKMRVYSNYVSGLPKATADESIPSLKLDTLTLNYVYGYLETVEKEEYKLEKISPTLEYIMKRNITIMGERWSNKDYANVLEAFYVASAAESTLTTLVGLRKHFVDSDVFFMAAISAHYLDRQDEAFSLFAQHINEFEKHEHMKNSFAYVLWYLKERKHQEEYEAALASAKKLFPDVQNWEKTEIQ